MEPIILASKSPRRQELIASVAKEFEVAVSTVEEVLPEGIAPEDAPVFLASLKARDVAKSHPNRTVVGADTVVILDDMILGKPRDRADAFRMLAALSGRTHTVVTGVCLTDGAREERFSAETRVEFYPLSREEIERYIDTGDPFDKAGAYGIQGPSKLFVKGIEGDFFNVMGLPVAKLNRKLRAFLAGSEG